MPEPDALPKCVNCGKGVGEHSHMADGTPTCSEPDALLALATKIRVAIRSYRCVVINTETGGHTYFTRDEVALLPALIRRLEAQGRDKAEAVDRAIRSSQPVMAEKVADLARRLAEAEARLAAREAGREGCGNEVSRVPFGSIEPVRN